MTDDERLIVKLKPFKWKTRHNREGDFYAQTLLGEFAVFWVEFYGWRLVLRRGVQHGYDDLLFKRVFASDKTAKRAAERYALRQILAATHWGIDAALAKFTAQQERLGPEFEAAIYANREGLYEE